MFLLLEDLTSPNVLDTFLNVSVLASQFSVSFIQLMEVSNVRFEILNFFFFASWFLFDFGELLLKFIVGFLF